MSNKTIRKDNDLTLSVLSAVAEDNKATQRSLSAELGIALGLTNAYLKRAVDKGLVKIKHIPSNRYLYYLTPKGFSEKSRINTQYLSTSFEFYRRAGDSCKEIFIQCDEDNLKKILLIGSSELTEIAVLRSHEFKLDIVGIYHPTSTSEKFVNIPIIKESDQLPEYDVAVITELSNIDQTIEVAYKAIDDRNKILIQF